MAARSERRCSIRISVLVALILGAPSVALSKEHSLENAEAPPEAKTHFDSGREHFRAGRYREAIVELKAALELDPDSPTLMYNVAYANELLGDLHCFRIIGCERNAKSFGFAKCVALERP